MLCDPTFRCVRRVSCRLSLHAHLQLDLSCGILIRMNISGSMLVTQVLSWRGVSSTCQTRLHRWDNDNILFSARLSGESNVNLSSVYQGITSHKIEPNYNYICLNMIVWSLCCIKWSNQLFWNLWKKKYSQQNWLWHPWLTGQIIGFLAELYVSISSSFLTIVLPFGNNMPKIRRIECTKFSEKVHSVDCLLARSPSLSTNV